MKKAMSTNTNVGSGALGAVTSGYQDTAVGVASLCKVKTGSDMTAVGAYAMANATDAAVLCTAVGANAMLNGTGPAYCTAVGCAALMQSANASRSVAVGNNAMESATNTAQAVAVGAQAVQAGADMSVGVGYLALAQTTQPGQVGVGCQALAACTTGQGNAAVGYLAMAQVTTGGQNVAVGYNAMNHASTSDSCTGTGYAALGWLSTGNGNTADGTTALGNVTSGSVNTGVGLNALVNITTCANMTAIGAYAGSPVVDTDSTQNGECTFLGCSAGSGTPSNSTGSYTNSTYIGYNAPVVSGQNEIVMGNADTEYFYCMATSVQQISDARDKTDIEPLSSTPGEAGALIDALSPVRFTWARRNGTKRGLQDVGFIAQQVEQAQVDTGVRVPMLVDTENPDQLHMDPAKLLPVVVQALKDLRAEFAEYKRRRP